MNRALLMALSVLGLSGTGAFAELIWVEGEAAVVRNVTPNAGLDEVDADELSGGAWLSHMSEAGKPAGTAGYDVNVPKAGSYNLWVRANPRGTGLAYRLPGGRWVPIDVKALQEQERKIASAKNPERRFYVDARPVSLDGSVGFRELTWLNAGRVQLKQGINRVEFLLGSDASTVSEKMFGALDVFVISDDPSFVPNAKFRPGEDWPEVHMLIPQNVWDFKPERDELSADALVDLRSLNEVPAGKSGFIRLSDDGMGFVRGDGTPIRFWGGSDYNQRNPKLQDLVRHANFLAKRGVNIVRWHGDLAPNEPRAGAALQRLEDVDEKEIDEAFKLVAAMKQAGIYTVLSPYWGSHTRNLPNWQIPDNENLAALVFFYPKVQEAYKSWLRALYTRPNPYTGIPLKDEPAVAIAQIQNEDSMLFFTMQRVKGEPLMVLRKQFKKWVEGKHGDYAKAMEAWQGYAHDDDDPEHEIPGLFIVWEFTEAARKQKGSAAGREKRLADQLQFMAETQYNWNREVARFLREDLGARHLVNAGNWRTVDTLTEDAERWSYTANEVIARNHYFGGQHKGLNVGWQILPHQYMSNPSATLKPEDLPVNVKQVVGHPFIIPESLWVPPMMYQSEGPLMVAAQTSLTGVDTFYWFANGVPEWQAPGNKWTYATPMQLGQFPAAALLYRLGYLKQAEPVVVEQRSLQNLWDRKTPIIAEGRAYDPNRDAGDMPVDSAVRAEVDPLAFVVGPVHVNYGGNPAETKVADLASFINRDKGLIRSVTGEIATNTELGLYTVNAPKAQGAAGALQRAGAIDLADLRIECRNDYATIVAVALDNRPLRESEKVLVQVGTVCRAAGWKARPAKFTADGTLIDGLRILDTGRGHWQIEKTDATVTLRNATVVRAVALDVNMMPVGELPLERDGDSVRVQLPPDSMYVVLMR